MEKAAFLAAEEEVVNGDAGLKQISPLVVHPVTGREFGVEDLLARLALLEDLFTLHEEKQQSDGSAAHLSPGTTMTVLTTISEVREMLNVGLYGAEKALYL